MKRLYEKNEILFAVLWILVYCFTTIPIRGNLGDESIWMTIVLIVIAVSATVFIKINHLEKKYGLTRCFRGFLFKALIPKDGIKLAVIISSVTFGIGHIINLFAGQASIETVIQVFFAIAWGFIFTFVFYKCESLLPCIIAHSLVDAFSKFANESNSDVSGWIYMGATILVAIVYGIYLAKLPRAEAESEEYS